MERRAKYLWISIPCGSVSYPFKAFWCSRLERFQNGCRIIAQSQVCMANNGGTSTCIAIKAGRRLRGDTVYEFDFANNFHVFAGIRTIKSAALHKDCADNIMPACQVSVKLIERVICVVDKSSDERVVRFREHRDKWTQIPQVVMRIDDRQIGLQDFLSHNSSTSPQ